MKTNLQKKSFQEQCWEQLKHKAIDPKSPFFYGVTSTNIYCRAGCPSPLPRRENVRFFSSVNAAQEEGFRACKRCEPDREQPVHLETVNALCQYLHNHERIPTAKELSQTFYLSSSHLSRLFKSILGLTPREYAEALRLSRLGEALQHNQDIAQAIYQAGFSSSSQVYQDHSKLLGMLPSSYHKKGLNQQIQIAIAQCYLGYILIAATSKGLCAIELGLSPVALLKQLLRRFENATVIEGSQAFQTWVALVLNNIKAPNDTLQQLPLDIQGTVFQRKVWRALLAIPWGETSTYGELAKQIGSPRAAQAVGQACGANPLAILIPCHRVLKNDGSLSGYRWGIEQKQKILSQEKSKEK